MPIDPASGGTWVAVNDAGVVLAVLNRNPPWAASGQRSRGLLIPERLGFRTVDEVRAMGVDPAAYAPFMLMAVSAAGGVSVEWDGREARWTELPAGRPVLATSSGLGDARVEGVRRRLFEESGVPTAGAQDAFHAHRWADRPEVSVLMERDGARTVSRTVVEVAGGVAEMRYSTVPMGVVTVARMALAAVAC